jgi:hypothetical protein
MLTRFEIALNDDSARRMKAAVLRLWSPVLVSLVALVAGCGTSADPPSSTGGTTSASGGAVGTTGGAATGGVVTAPTGGVTASGGSSPTGGSSTGGAPLGGSVGTGGAGGVGVSTGGAATTGGASPGTGGAGGVSSNGGSGGGGGSTATAGSTSTAGATSTSKFSFFVTSQVAIVAVSKSDMGFGGDLTFGETGAGAGLRGADKICAAIAERGMPGAGSKPWRAFLSATDDGTGKQVDAVDRVGEGPWYDRKGRLFAARKADLVTTRPTGADPQIINDFPNEDGVPNHAPDGSKQVDNHDVLTGTGENGKLFSATATCKDWTSSDGATGGKPRVGHSWPRSGPTGGFPGAGGGGGGGGSLGGIGDTNNWMSALDEAGCGKGFNIVEMGPPNASNPTVGSGGGYGAIYCFSLTP